MQLCGVVIQGHVLWPTVDNVRKQMAAKLLKVQYIPTDYQTVDVFNHCQLLGLAC